MSDGIGGLGTSQAFTNLYAAQRAQTDTSRSESLFVAGEKLYGGPDFVVDLVSAWYDDRTERLRGGSEWVRHTIDKQFGPGLGHALLSSLSAAAGHDLNASVTRGDLETINNALARREATWTQVTGATLQDTTARIDELKRRGFPEADRLAKDLADLKDITLWGAGTLLPQRWAELRDRLDRTERANNASLIMRDTSRRLEIMAGKGGAAAEMAAIIQGSLDKARAANKGDYKSITELHRIQRMASRELDDWVTVAKHNQGRHQLMQMTSAVAEIKGVKSRLIDVDTKVAKALDEAIGTYDNALKQVQKAEVNTLRVEQLNRLRQDVVQARDQLCATFESVLKQIDSTDISRRYFQARAQDLLVENATLIEQAKSIPVVTPQTTQLQRELWVAIDAAQTSSPGVGKGPTSTANAQPPPVNSSNSSRIDAFDDDSDSEQSIPGPDRSQLAAAERAVAIAHQLMELQSAHGLGTWQVDQQTHPQADQQAQVLTQQIHDLPPISQDPSFSTMRSDAAIKLVLSNDKTVLARLKPEAALDLLQALLSANNLPASNPTTKDQPIREALRKLYSAMPLDPTFVAADNRLREQTVAALLQNHGDELLLYRQTWAAMTDDQRMVAVDRVVTAHCQVLQIPKPTIKWGHEVTQGAHFAPTPAGEIELGRGIAYHDFGSMMTMVLHETTHHHQQVQVNQAKAQQPVPFPTQVAIFGANISAYVDGTEDQVGYRDQPIEAHAFMAGGHAATLLMIGLDRLEASRT